MRLLKRAVRRVVRVVLRPRRLRRLVASELRSLDQRTAPATGPRSAGERRRFVDGTGREHVLDPDLRDRLKPNWRTMVDPVEVAALPSAAVLAGRARKAQASAAEARALVATVTGAALTGRILEIGCYDGAVSFELARDPDTEMVASDLARYYVTQRPGVEDTDTDRELHRLATIREHAAQVAGVEPRRVRFVEDDITASALEPGTFDAIVSFEVLEHVADPSAALAAMARLLRPGGVAYHDYNPFFSAIGGHSLVTLDIPWGHARLDDADVERYLREIRPAEADQALRFYRVNLNRMTLAALRDAIASAGLEPLAIVPWHQRTLVPDVSPQLLEEVRRTYPAATLDDLLATFVTVVTRKP